MRKRMMAWIPLAGLSVLVLMTGCQGRGEDDAVEDSMGNVAYAAEAEDGSGFVEREFWLALAEEPGWHLEEARKLYMGGDARAAADELTKVAALLKFETRHSGSEEATRRLLASVEELREVARTIRFQEEPNWTAPNKEELNRVEAQAFWAMGVHHLSLAEESALAADPLMASRYITESANDVEMGFARAGADPGRTMMEDVADAQALATRLAEEGDGDPVAIKDSIDRLGDAINGLGEILDSRRK